jgi:ubiquitin-activating enzyme E1
VLHDKKSEKTWDLGSNFKFSESDIGKNRALACANKLQELSTAVLVRIYTSELTEELLSDFQVVRSVLCSIDII